MILSARDFAQDDSFLQKSLQHRKEKLHKKVKGHGEGKKRSAVEWMNLLTPGPWQWPKKLSLSCLCGEDN